MQLLLILAVLAALTVSNSGLPQPVSGVAGRLMIAAGGIMVVVGFAAVASDLIARRLRTDFTRHRLLLRRFRRLRRVHLVLWLATAGGILYGLDWGRLVRFNWQLGRVPLVDELLILVPVLLPLVLSWAAFYEVDRAVIIGMTGGTAGAGQVTTRRRYLAFHVRHYLGILLVPVLLLFAVQDAVELLAPQVLESGHGALVFVPWLAVLLLLFPVLLRFLWETQPLPPGPLRSRLEAAAGKVGLRQRDILVWHTGGMVVNAAVAGFTRHLRYVFLTDALLAQLTDEEIESVFGHELGHVRHRHLPLRVTAIVVPLSLWLLVGQAFPEAVGRFEQWLQPAGLGGQVPTGLATLAVMAVYAALVFGYYCRQLEHQADLFGCGLGAADPAGAPIETFTSALEKLADCSGHGRKTSSWQHASVAHRVDFLQRLNRDPKRMLRFQRRVRLLGSLMIGIVVSPMVYQLLLG